MRTPFHFPPALETATPSRSTISAPGNAPAPAEAARRAGAMHNSKAVRWYVMQFPAVNYRNAERELAQEQERHRRLGEPEFEFCAPRFVEYRVEGGAVTDTHRPLFFNYAFIRASEQEIFRMKQNALRRFNFLPRVRQGGREYYPYVPDEAMRTVLWISRSFSNTVPVCTGDTAMLVRGDRVRIVEGPLRGVEARVVRQPGSGRSILVAYVENWMWVPLVETSHVRYEVIALSDAQSFYSAYDYDRTLDRLHRALLRRIAARRASDGVEDSGAVPCAAVSSASAADAAPDDFALALSVIRRMEAAKIDTAALRCKQQALLLMAAAVLGDTQKLEQLQAAVAPLLPAVTNEAGLALLLVTLYACTDSSIYHRQAHEALRPHSLAPAPKKAFRTLIAHLADYDRALGHS